MGEKMDEIEGGVLARFPPGALTLTLTRAAIRMQHATTWRIEKENPVEDLVIALEGQGHYRIGNRLQTLSAGEAMLLPRDTPFEGWNEGPDTYLGVAQHFTLSAHGAQDLIGQMRLRPKVRLSRWEVLGPMIRHYRQSAPPASVTLPQHHLFMVMLLSFVDDAFLGWREEAVPVDPGAGIDLAVMKAASRIAAAPLEAELAVRVVEDAPYNPDYFHRAFRDRIGRTPKQYQEFCRIERAAHLLESGLTVGAAGAEVGYADPYYFSRCFKRIMGLSPRAHMRRVALSRDGQLMGMDEPEQEAALTGSRPGAG